MYRREETLAEIRGAEMAIKTAKNIIWANTISLMAFEGELKKYPEKKCTEGKLPNHMKLTG